MNYDIWGAVSPSGGKEVDLVRTRGGLEAGEGVQGCAPGAALASESEAQRK